MLSRIKFNKSIIEVARVFFVQTIWLQELIDRGSQWDNKLTVKRPKNVAPGRENGPLF